MITVLEPSAHCVYQRDCEGGADIPFAVRISSEFGGTIEARLLAEDGGAIGRAIVNREGTLSTGIREETLVTARLERVSVGTREGIWIAGGFERVPTGSYRMELFVRDGEVERESLCVEAVHVGDLWVLAGQSNMEGCGKLVGVEQPEDGICCYYMGDRWGIAEEPLHWFNESLDPVHWRVPEEELGTAVVCERRDRSIGAGLGLAFAKEVRRHEGVPVGLIVCAYGGSSMADWGPVRMDESGSTLYGALLRRVRKLGGRVKGCLWYQGEAEANERDAPLYAERLRTWVASLREDLRDSALPFVYAQLSTVHFMDANSSWWNAVQEEQRLAEEALAPAAMVPTVDATLSDIIHVGTESMKEIGRRMAWQALRIAYGRQAYETGPRPGVMRWNEERTLLRLEIEGAHGKLRESDRVYGFSVEADDVPVPVKAAVSQDGRSIELRFEEPVSAVGLLRHGAGFNPTVNVADSKGIPLPVFGPLEI